MKFSFLPAPKIHPLPFAEHFCTNTWGYRKGGSFQAPFKVWSGCTGSDLPWKFVEMQVIRPSLLNWLLGVGPGNLHFKQILQGRIFFFFLNMGLKVGRIHLWTSLFTGKPGSSLHKTPGCTNLTSMKDLGETEPSPSYSPCSIKSKISVCVYVPFGEYLP